MTHLKKAALAICIQTALFGQCATAQQANSANEKERSLEKITVTAQKRAQSIQEVPISIATLNGEQFESISSLARKYFSVLPTSTSVERLWSSVKNVYQGRYQLGVENLKNQIMVKANWSALSANQQENIKKM